MKPLPTPPPAYERPKERWFENHTHPTWDGELTTSIIATSKTLNAMWLMLHDRTMRPLPSKVKTHSTSERDYLMKLLKAKGDSAMEYWGDLCDTVDREQDVERSWQYLITKRLDK